MLSYSEQRANEILAVVKDVERQIFDIELKAVLEGKQIKKW